MVHIINYISLCIIEMNNPIDNNIVSIKLSSQTINVDYDIDQLSKVPDEELCPIGINTAIDSYKYFLLPKYPNHRIIGEKIMTEYLWINIPLLLKINSSYFNTYLGSKLLELQKSELRSNKSYDIFNLGEFINRRESVKIAFDRWFNYRLNEEYVYSWKKKNIKKKDLLCYAHRYGGIIETDNIASIRSVFSEDTLYLCPSDLHHIFPNENVLDIQKLSASTVGDLEPSFLHRKRICVINCTEIDLHLLKMVVNYFCTEIIWLVYLLPIRYFFNNSKCDEYLTNSVSVGLNLNNILSIANLWFCLENGQKKEYRRELIRFFLSDLSSFYGTYFIQNNSMEKFPINDLLDQDEHDLLSFVKNQLPNFFVCQETFNNLCRNVSSFFLHLMMSYKTSDTIREALNMVISHKIKAIEDTVKYYIDIAEKSYHDDERKTQSINKLINSVQDSHHKYNSIKTSNIYSDTECCICYDPVSIEAIMICGHSMCVKCMITTVCKSNSSCPNCRVSIKIEETRLLKKSETFLDRIRKYVGSNYFMTDLPPLYDINSFLIDSFRDLIGSNHMTDMKKLFMFFGKRRKDLSQLIAYINLINPSCEIIIIDCNLL